MSDKEKEAEIRKGYTPPKPEEEIIKEGYVLPLPPEKPEGQPLKESPKEED